MKKTFTLLKLHGSTLNPFLMGTCLTYVRKQTEQRNARKRINRFYWPLCHAESQKHTKTEDQESPLNPLNILDRTREMSHSQNPQVWNKRLHLNLRNALFKENSFANKVKVSGFDTTQRSLQAERGYVPKPDIHGGVLLLYLFFPFLFNGWKGPGYRKNSLSIISEIVQHL